MNKPYVCPHCGKEIKEVNVVELNLKQLLISAGMGFGIGMIVMPAFPQIGLLGTIGAFILAFVVTLVMVKRK